MQAMRTRLDGLVQRREREIERGREREIEREREAKREKGRQRWRQREGERECVFVCLCQRRYAGIKKSTPCFASAGECVQIEKPLS